MHRGCFDNSAHFIISNVTRQVVPPSEQNSNLAQITVNLHSTMAAADDVFLFFHDLPMIFSSLKKIR